MYRNPTSHPSIMTFTKCACKRHLEHLIWKNLCSWWRRQCSSGQWQSTSRLTANSICISTCSLAPEGNGGMRSELPRKHRYEQKAGNQLLNENDKKRVIWDAEGLSAQMPLPVLPYGNSRGVYRKQHLNWITSGPNLRFSVLIDLFWWESLFFSGAAPGIPQCHGEEDWFLQNFPFLILISLQPKKCH